MWEESRPRRDMPTGSVGSGGGEAGHIHIVGDWEDGEAACDAVGAGQEGRLSEVARGARSSPLVQSRLFLAHQMHPGQAWLPSRGAALLRLPDLTDLDSQACINAGPPSPLPT